MSITQTQKDVETSMQYLTSSLVHSPFPIHNGERTEASKALLRKVDKSTGSFPVSLQSAVEYPDRVTDTCLEEDALM